MLNSLKTILTSKEFYRAATYALGLAGAAVDPNAVEQIGVGVVAALGVIEAVTAAVKAKKQKPSA